jgi:hypothetical protein
MDRTPIDLLELQGNKSNLKRALKRQEKDAAKSLSPSNKKRLAVLDQLIEQAMEECAEGSSVGDKQKRNPAFANLESLMRTRKLLLRENPPETKKSTEDLLAEVDVFLGKEN